MSVAAWLLWPTQERGEVTEPTKQGLIKEVKPSVVLTNAAPVKTDYAALSNWDLRHLKESETNNLTETQVRYWRMYHPYPPPGKDQPRGYRGRYSIFESQVDNEIASILVTEPGTMILGSGEVRPGFEEKFLKSLKRPIIVKENDSEYDKELKRSVIQAKADLKAAYDRGEDITKIMNDARTELQKLGRYRAEAEKLAMVELHKKGKTAEEAEDTIRAVNKLLESKGIAPIEENGISRLGLKLQSIKHREENQ